MARLNDLPSLQSGGFYSFPDSGGLALLHGREWVIPDLQVPPWLREALQAAIAGRADSFASVRSATAAGASLGSLRQPAASAGGSADNGAVNITQTIYVTGLHAHEVEPLVTTAIRKNNSEVVRLMRAR